jgi:myo-inositol-1(or 4)-monophosphatase
MLHERTLTKSPLLNVMIAAVLNASRGVRRDYSELSMLQNSKRNSDQFVAKTIERAHENIGMDLQKARPKFTFATEDMALKADQEYWLIAPIVGLDNLKRALPQFCVTIAYSRGEEIAAGVIYDVLRDEVFWAEKGGGAYLNRERLRVSDPKRIEDSLCIVHTSQLAAVTEHASIKPEHIRLFDCPALDIAYVGAARADVYVGPELSLLSIGTSKLLIQEAGGAYQQHGDSVIAGNNDTIRNLAIR